MKYVLAGGLAWGSAGGLAWGSAGGFVWGSAGLRAGSPHRHGDVIHMEAPGDASLVMQDLATRNTARECLEGDPGPC